MKIKTIIRLNEPLYHEREFTSQGIKVVNLEFTDGTCPSDDVIWHFINEIENNDSAVAVHCRAGLGRTGTLIGCYIMYKYPHWEPVSLIGWLRIARPGSVIGKQQQFLIDI